MKKTHENKLSIVPSQVFVLTFQTRLYIDKGWLNFSCSTQTFLFYANVPFICRIIENSRRNVSMKCGIHLTIWKNKLFSKHVFMLINFIYRNKNSSEITKIDVPVYRQFWRALKSASRTEEFSIKQYVFLGFFWCDSQLD